MYTADIYKYTSMRREDFIHKTFMKVSCFNTAEIVLCFIK